jgi:osmotically-inducible protein OsmY
MKRVFQTFALTLASVVMLHAAPQQTAPDNTKANKAETPTAQQQSNTKSDLETAKQIRRAIVSDKSLSTYAHNVKVIAKDGQITLKGPVRSEDERKAVAAKAAEVAGAAKVVNELEVAASTTSHK